MGTAGGVTINQGTEADLVGDAKASEAFHHDAGDDANHGCAAVKQFNLLELLHEGQLFRAVIKRWVVRRSVGHGFWWRNSCWQAEEARARGSISKIRLVESTNNPGTDKNDGDCRNHPTLLARSVGRLST